MRFLKVITIAGLTLFCVLFIHAKVRAESSIQEFSAYYDINKNNIASVKFVNELTNPSNTTLIDKYTIIIPFSDAKDIVITSNGERVNVNKYDYNDHIEISINLKDTPIGSGRKYIFESVFTTAQIADNFYGFRRVYIPGVDKSIKVKEIKIKLPQEWKTDDGSHELSYAINSNIYLVFGESAFVNFSLDQKLENKEGKGQKTKFLLPYENSLQRVLYLPSISKFGTYAGKNYTYAELSLAPSNKDEIHIEGYIQFGAGLKVVDGDSLLDETSVWDYNSSPMQDLKKQFENSTDKLKDIYSYILTKYHPVNGKMTERQKISDLASKTELSEIQYCDLSAGLLRSLGIKSTVNIGHNFAISKIGKNLEYSCWVEYRINNNSGWKIFDPYFAQTQDLEIESASKPDRAGYFILDGKEDQDLFNYFFSDGSNYVTYKTSDNRIWDKETFNYDFYSSVPDKVPLNVGFSVNILVKNNSNQILGLSAATSNKDALDLVSEDDSLWIFPGQSKNFEIKTLKINGIGIKKDKNFDLKFKITNVLSDEKTESVAKTITGIPTLESFISFFIIIAGIILITVLIIYNKKAIKKAFKGKLNRFRK